MKNICKHFPELALAFFILGGTYVIYAQDRLIDISTSPTDQSPRSVTASGTVIDSDVDTDGDGLPDDWERRYGYNPYSRDSDMDCQEDGLEDANGDGESNATTYANEIAELNNLASINDDEHSDSNVPSPLFLDGDLDGLSDEEEEESGTDPNSPDSDGDGVLDGEDGWALCSLLAPARVKDENYIVIPVQQIDEGDEIRNADLNNNGHILYGVGEINSDPGFWTDEDDSEEFYYFSDRGRKTLSSEDWEFRWNMGDHYLYTIFFKSEYSINLPGTYTAYHSLNDSNYFIKNNNNQGNGSERAERSDELYKDGLKIATLSHTNDRADAYTVLNNGNVYGLGDKGSHFTAIWTPSGTLEEKNHSPRFTFLHQGSGCGETKVGAYFFPIMSNNSDVQLAANDTVFGWGGWGGASTSMSCVYNDEIIENLLEVSGGCTAGYSFVREYNLSHNNTIQILHRLEGGDEIYHMWIDNKAGFKNDQPVSGKPDLFKIDWDTSWGAQPPLNLTSRMQGYLVEGSIHSNDGLIHTNLIWQNGNYKPLEIEGYTDIQIHDINDHGVICAAVTDINEQQHLALIHPVEQLELKQDGSMEVIAETPVSRPYPTFYDDTVTPSDLTIQDDGSLTVNLDIDATLDDPLADITPPGEPAGEIQGVLIWVNGSEQHYIPNGEGLSSQKQNTGSIGYQQYDYTGNLDVILNEIPVTEGLNTIRIEAYNAVGGIGHTLHTFEVTSTTSPLGNDTGFNLTFNQGLSPDTIEEVIVEVDTGTGLKTYVLSESCENSRTFSEIDPIGSNWSFQLKGGSELWSDTAVDTINILTSDGQDFSINETGGNSLMFQRVSSNGSSSVPEYELGESKFIESSREGEMFITMWRIRGMSQETANGMELKMNFPEAAKLTGQPFEIKDEAGEPLADGALLSPLANYDRGVVSFDGQDGMFLANAAGDGPATIMATQIVDGIKGAFNVDDVLARLSSNVDKLPDLLQFQVGYQAGLASGGVALLSDGVKLIFTPLIKQLDYLTLSITDHAGLRKQFDQDVTSIVGTTTAISKFALDVYDLYTDFRADELLVTYSLLTGDLETVRSIGGPYAEAFSIAGELIAEVFKDLAGLAPKEQGIRLGRMVFEIAAIFVPVSKITAGAKLTKVGFLKKAKAGNGLIKARALSLFNFERKLDKTKMCFLAGTMVMSAHGMQAIETVQAGDVVWSKCEVTHQEGWKPVLDTFITNPSELYHLGVDYNGDHKVDETLTGTGEHPFYLTNRTEAGFFPLRELKRYDQLVLAHGKNAQVISLNTERGPPSETFTTYNFEVADYHTYFVGKNGVWVHNEAKAPCEKLRALIEKILDYQNFKGNIGKSYGDVVRRLDGKMNDELKSTFVDGIFKDLEGLVDAGKIDPHLVKLGTDALDNKLKPRELFTASRLQNKTTVKLTDRAQVRYDSNGDIIKGGDFVDSNGEVWDAVGPLAKVVFNSDTQVNKFIDSVIEHIDIIEKGNPVVDLVGMPKSLQIKTISSIRNKLKTPTHLQPETVLELLNGKKIVILRD